MKNDAIHMQRMLQYFGLILTKVTQSIAFIPCLLVLFFLIFTAIILGVDIEITLQDYFLKVITVTKSDASKTIFSTIAAGTISLMVFSFSMVMLVLNQATSNFSPRVLPSLVADRKHQITLGFYAGSILFNFLMLLGLGSKEIPDNNLAIATLFALMTILINISLFVMFIHNISRSIQMGNIIRKLKSETTADLKKDIKPIEKPDTTHWHKVYSIHSGYFHGILIRFVNNYFKNKSHHIFIKPSLNDYVRKGELLYYIKQDVPQEPLASITESFILQEQQHDNRNTVNRIILLQEIAIKAMSPGINDPGTMLEIVTTLEELLLKYLSEPPYYEERNKTNKIKIYLKNTPVAVLFERIYLPIINYGKDDPVVLRSILVSLQHLKGQKIGFEEKSMLNKLISSCK